MRALIESLDEPRLEPWLAAWPTDQHAQDTAAAQPVPTASLPVLKWLAIAAAAAPGFSAELCAALVGAAGDLAWRQTYNQADVAAGAIAADFLERYGWCELIGPRSAINSERIACGCLLLGPDTLYPSHRHEAEELYIPLSGNAAWRQGNCDWQQRSPGTPIHHASFQPHAMRTQADPLLALYFWRGNGIGARASLGA